MKNKIIKKGLGFIGLVTLILALFINTNVLNTSNSDFSFINLLSLNTANADLPWPWSNPWDIDWGTQEQQQNCRYDLGGGWFTGSINMACIPIECVIPLDCDCTPIPCGQV